MMLRGVLKRPFYIFLLLIILKDCSWGDYYYIEWGVYLFIVIISTISVVFYIVNGRYLVKRERKRLWCSKYGSRVNKIIVLTFR